MSRINHFAIKFSQSLHKSCIKSSSLAALTPLSRPISHSHSLSLTSSLSSLSPFLSRTAVTIARNNRISNFYQQKVELENGDELSFSTKLDWKVVLIVNLAFDDAKFGSQLLALERLHQQYQDRGLIIVGIPSAEFGGSITKPTGQINFHLTKPAKLNGDAAHPLFAYLQSIPSTLGAGTEISGNFEKFLFDRRGVLCDRYASEIAPELIEKQIDILLTKKYVGEHMRKLRPQAIAKQQLKKQMKAAAAAAAAAVASPETETKEKSVKL